MRTIVIWKQSFVELWDWIIIIFKTTVGPKSFSRFHNMITNLYIFSLSWFFRSYWHVYDYYFNNCQMPLFWLVKNSWYLDFRIGEKMTWTGQHFVKFKGYWNFDKTLNMFWPHCLSSIRRPLATGQMSKFVCSITRMQMRTGMWNGLV
jgi:hypothetical protein